MRTDNTHRIRFAGLILLATLLLLPATTGAAETTMGRDAFVQEGYYDFFPISFVSETEYTINIESSTPVDFFIADTTNAQQYVEIVERRDDSSFSTIKTLFGSYTEEFSKTTFSVTPGSDFEAVIIIDNTNFTGAIPQANAEISMIIDSVDNSFLPGFGLLPGLLSLAVVALIGKKR